MNTAAIADLIRGVTGKWAKQRKAEERHARAAERREEALISYRRVSLKEAAAEVMREAYLKASANGTLPVNPRQIMYAARPQILERTGKDSLNGQYFSQTLLVDYMDENPGETARWDIIADGGSS
jgi:hypothetical protein